MPRTITLTDKQLIDELQSLYGVELTAADIKGFCKSRSINYQTVTKRLERYKVGRGKWNLEVTLEAVQNIERSFSAPAVESIIEQDLVPEKDDTFIKFGNFNDVKAIIKAGMFYPTFITGLSGNGKTFSVEQACAQLNKELSLIHI